MTPIKCPRCGLTNWSTDINCSGCEFIFQPETSPAIQKPMQPLPETSFADLAEPDDDSALLPSHSRTPQMIARIAVTQGAVKETKAYQQKEFVNYDLQSKPNSFYPPPIQLSMPAVKTGDFHALSQPQITPAKTAKSKNTLLIAAIVIGILGLFTAVVLAGILFLNRSLFV